MTRINDLVIVSGLGVSEHKSSPATGQAVQARTANSNSAKRGKPFWQARRLSLGGVIHAMVLPELNNKNFKVLLVQN
jgi:hypothetical protein